MVAASFPDAAAAQRRYVSRTARGTTLPTSSRLRGDPPRARFPAWPSPFRILRRVSKRSPWTRRSTRSNHSGIILSTNLSCRFQTGSASSFGTARGLPRQRDCWATLERGSGRARAQIFLAALIVPSLDHGSTLLQRCRASPRAKKSRSTVSSPISSSNSFSRSGLPLAASAGFSKTDAARSRNSFFHL